MEQQLATGLDEGHVAEFVENDEVEAAEPVIEPSLTPGPSLGRELVDEIDDIEEAATCD